MLYIVFVCLIIFSNFSFYFFFGPMLFMSVLFEFHIFVRSPVLLLLLIFSFIPFCLKKILGMILVFLNLLCIILWPRMCRLFCVYLRMCILLLLGRMFCMSVRSFWSITSLKFAFSLLIFYLDYPYIFEILVLKSIIVLFFSFQICQCLLYIFRFFGVENIYIHNCYIFLLIQLFYYL